MSLKPLPLGISTQQIRIPTFTSTLLNPVLSQLSTPLCTSARAPGPRVREGEGKAGRGTFPASRLPPPSPSSARWRLTILAPLAGQGRDPAAGRGPRTRQQSWRQSQGRRRRAPGGGVRCQASRLLPLPPADNGAPAPPPAPASGRKAPGPKPAPTAGPTLGLPSSSVP